MKETTIKKKGNKTTSMENTGLSPPVDCRPVSSTARGFGRVPLPLSWEIITADVSLSGNEGAWVFGRGSGWEIINTRCRKVENTRYSKNGDLVNGGVRRWYMNVGFTDPESMSHDTALPRQLGIPFSTLILHTTPIRQVLFPRLGCSNPVPNLVWLG